MLRLGAVGFVSAGWVLLVCWPGGRPGSGERGQGVGVFLDPGVEGEVVVVGAGFADLAAVRRLARAGVHTTLIDRSVHATFQPLLYQVATGGLASGALEVVSP